MPYRRWIRVGPIGVGLPELWWGEPPYWVDVERTADEVIITLRIPRDVKKEEGLGKNTNRVEITQNARKEKFSSFKYSMLWKSSYEYLRQSA